MEWIHMIFIRGHWLLISNSEYKRFIKIYPAWIIWYFHPHLSTEITVILEHSFQMQSRSLNTSFTDSKSPKHLKASEILVIWLNATFVHLWRQCLFLALQMEGWKRNHWKLGNIWEQEREGKLWLGNKNPFSVKKKLASCLIIAYNNFPIEI